jgi:hypothetical protein
MLIYRVNKSSFYCRASFICQLKLSVLSSIVACSYYEASYSLYVFIEHFLKCTECIYKDHFYNSNFLSEDFNKIKKEKEKL